ncbi:MAG: glycerophosphodiester phosphodiesterase [Luteitalea sp.]|nr:glycerophosphodiester phosphodiesterase [Luteitalea sp.]
MTKSLAISMVLLATTLTAARPAKVVIAHRGASAYAPENTLAAFRLAADQKADYVEIDITFTRDGHLVVLHDDTLERTTNVEDLFPDRGQPANAGSDERRWPVKDFTLEEVRRLDAGSWFDQRFAGERIPTFEGAVDAVTPRTGLLIELKSPDKQRAAGRAMEPLVADVLRARDLAGAPRDEDRPPIIVQSFDEGGVRELAKLLPDVPRVLLFSPPAAPRWTSASGLKEVSGFATGIGPNKDILDKDPVLVRRAHELGLFVFAWTYRAESTAEQETARAAMQRGLTILGLDGVITDNPDLGRSGG